MIVATGQLHQPALPRLPGADDFAGHSFHSARWDHEYDLTGRRVAVIGTGASAIQFIPEIAEEVGQLSVFQRTGNWFLPRRNRPYPWLIRQLIEHVPGLQALRRAYIYYYAELADADDPPPENLGTDREAHLDAAHAPPAQGSRGAAQGLAGLHVRVQADPVQLGISARPAAAER